MLNNKNELSQALHFVYRELSQWNLRNAANDNRAAALVFLCFLKYVSDNKQILRLEYDEKYNFDYLSVLFGERLAKDELVYHVANIERQLGHDNGILESYANGLDLIKFSRKNTHIMEVLNSVDMSDMDNDHCVYEALADYFSVTLKKELRFSAESTTDQNLAKLMAKIANPQNGTLYDFAVGFGILTIEAAKGQDIHVYAQDIDKTCAAVALMMLTMAGCLSSTVLCNDTITHPLYTAHKGMEAFDFVLSAPPFGLRLSPQLATFQNEIQADAFEYSFEFKLTGDLTFSRHLLASLKNGGVGVIQVPMSSLFRGGSEERIRASMLRDNYIDAIIELPKGIVAATSLKTALIVFRKGRQQQDIYMLDASREAAKDFIEASNRASVRITDYGIKQISRLVQERAVVDGLSARITLDEIRSKNFNFSAGAYLQKSIDEVVIKDDIEALQNKNAELMEKLIHLDKRLNEYLERIR